MASESLPESRAPWASDYPHPDSTFARSREVIEHEFAPCPADEATRMTGGNVARLYHFGA
jgi:predicted TIM-barrel fold metal-dependent hydrolase